MKFTRRFTLLVGAAIAASALLSAFQPASAQVFGPSWARAEQQQGDFYIHVFVWDYDDSSVCARISNVVTGESHWGSCENTSEAEVSVTLDSARGAGTVHWSTTSPGKGRGSKGGGATKYGSLTMEMTWVAAGELQTNVLTTGDLLDPTCWFLQWDGVGCRPGVEADQTRAATASGTVIDSEWGTFVLDGVSGYMFRDLI